ncbi:ATP-binding protein [Burkholderia vietnamiensis]|uniref:ATP-binding protein n=1 Tax=Burkholderia vietnamiensis TaxID=60552 RepID=UPI003310CB64|nr:ATP-binding protein [Burkholderia vietnamiensis]
MLNQTLATSPYDPARYVGSVTYVGPESTRINLPFAASIGARQHAGYAVHAGLVGEFVFIQGEEIAVLGRIVEVWLPDRERLSVEEPSNGPPTNHPTGNVQLLTSLDLRSGCVISGIPEHPRIGQHVFSAHPLLVQQMVEGRTSGPLVELAALPQDSQTKVHLAPTRLFGRHCALLGATGGGKSWSVARIVGEIERLHGKIVLIDPTGEFHTIQGATRHVYLGGTADGPDDKRLFAGFPYWLLSELDLFAIFQPSNATQAPKLREALRSLKLAYAIDGDKAEPYVKQNKSRKDFFRLWAQHEASVEAEGAKYYIQNLPKQILEECVYETARDQSDHWGGMNDQVRGYCETLVAKVYSITRSKPLACLFKPDDYPFSLPDILDDFLQSTDAVLRVSMENVPFEHNARELMVNAIGRYLLHRARQGAFKSLPLVVALDEAHQFLNKDIGDEAHHIKLDAFGIVAKEGRKYGLTVLLATQRPRDIPEDVLSQMGMFIVHRLINQRDREIVEKACGNLDGSAAAFLPTLGQGEAILVGVDFPMPTPVRILPPKYHPESKGPNYEECWGLKSSSDDPRA